MYSRVKHVIVEHRRKRHAKLKLERSSFNLVYIFLQTSIQHIISRASTLSCVQGSGRCKELEILIAHFTTLENVIFVGFTFNFHQ